MDKQMIEEMAQCKNRFGMKCSDCYTKSCERYILAEELYNAGYRKIPKNAVARMDRKMFNEIANDILLSVKPVYLRKEIVCKMLDLIDRLMVQTRKETAEKFAERLKKRFSKSREYYEVDTGTAWSNGRIGGLINDTIDEICKEITEVDYAENGS